jgi:hypothetical protein
MEEGGRRGKKMEEQEGRQGNISSHPTNGNRFFGKCKLLRSLGTQPAFLSYSLSFSLSLPGICKTHTTFVEHNPPSFSQSLPLRLVYLGNTTRGSDGCK